MLKKYFNIFLLATLPLGVFAQKVSISPLRNNVLYIDLDNPLTIVVEGQSCKDLIIKTDNGKIEGSNGDYYCKPNSLGLANIDVYSKQRGILKKVSSIQFRVKYFVASENIKFCIANVCTKGTISKSLLLEQKYVRAQVLYTEINAVYPVDKFDLEINNNGIIETFHNISNELNQDIISSFTKLKDNALLSFKNIYTHRPNGEQFPLSDLEISVSE